MSGHCDRLIIFLESLIPPQNTTSLYKWHKFVLKEPTNICAIKCDGVDPSVWETNRISLSSVSDCVINFLPFIITNKRCHHFFIHTENIWWNSFLLIRRKLMLIFVKSTAYGWNIIQNCYNKRLTNKSNYVFVRFMERNFAYFFTVRPTRTGWVALEI